MKTKMTDSLTVRLDHNLKNEAEIVLEAIGIKPADAVRTLFKQIVLQKGLPYQVKIPNEETIEAMSETDAMIKRFEKGEDIGGYSSVEEMHESM